MKRWTAFLSPGVGHFSIEGGAEQEPSLHGYDGDQVNRKKNQNFIQIYNNKKVKIVPNNTIDKILEGVWGITKAKRHD